MPDIPITSPLSYIGVLFLFIGAFLVIAGLDIIKIEKIIVVPGKKTWGFGIIMALIGILFLFPDILKTSPPSTATATPTVTQVPKEDPTTLTPPTDQPPPTSKPLSINGIWEGITTGTNIGTPISERLTTVSILGDCQVDTVCGFFQTEGGCNYELTMIGVQDGAYIFGTRSVSGADFCYDSISSPSDARTEIKILSDTELEFYFETLSDVIREGTLTKKE